MPLDFERLCESLSMTEMIRLQTMLSGALVRRFEARLSVAFSDLVESTRYFSKFGDVAGKELQQRHVDLARQAVSSKGGRIVDTAGDGIFLCFEDIDTAAAAMMELLELISVENGNRPRARRLAVRIGIHFGPVLTDGVQVTGESVNYCSRAAASADPGEIRISKEAFSALMDVQLRLKCRRLPPVTVKGIDQPIQLLRLDWRDRMRFPSMVRFDTGAVHPLPDHDIISFGRLRERDGFPANDIVLECEDGARTLQISRWHFELRRGKESFVMRTVTAAPTLINGRPLEKGEEAPLQPGDDVRVGNVLTLHFEASPDSKDSRSAVETISLPHPP